MNASVSEADRTAEQGERFFRDARLPFAEWRHSTNSTRTYKPHMHRCFSIGAVDRGKIHYRLEEQSYRLLPGQLALINPETLHACNQDDTSPRSYSMLYLQTDWCLQVQQSLWQVEHFVPAQLSLLEDSILYERYVTTRACLMAEEPLLEKEQQLTDLVAAIFLKTCNPGRQSQPTPLRIAHLKALLAAELREDLTLEQLAGNLGTQASSLIRQFKEATGITPHAYRMNCRINQARQLLQQGRDISETALECGFFDQSHFHRHFKAMTTVTPREYQVNFVQ